MKRNQVIEVPDLERKPPGFREPGTRETDAAWIAHDLNNLLAAISGYAEMLLEDLPPGSPSSHKAREILKAADKAGSLTQEILHSGTNAPQRKEIVSVDGILRECIGLIRGISSPDITIRTSLTRDETNVMAVPGHLFRIFINLMTNAIQAMEGKTGKLTVRLARTKDNELMKEHGNEIPAGEYAVISFTDTGRGIDKRELERIFEPGFTTRASGTGLGLSVVSGLVKDMGGYVRVSSVPGRGSRFGIILPVARPSQ